MTLNRRRFGQAMAATSLTALGAPSWAETGPLKISHQFPGGTADSGDFRDRLCRRFAAEVEKRTNGALKSQVYPGASLMKVNAQFRARSTWAWCRCRMRAAKCPKPMWA
jgi:TRAP-type C4-dicarboxylate transport system substrate-binding protein